MADAPITRGTRPPIAAEAFLRALSDHGTDYFFANPGTDFPPIVEAYDHAKKTNAKVPQPVLVPHENLAVAMAHGAYLMTGRPQAVMVHVNVGTANTINNVANLSRDQVPLILAAGRTPVTEKGSFGSRSRPIHWAQEMFDQAGMLREFVKWDYELRTPGQIGDMVSRACEVAMSSPRGPVYLVLPREPLSAPLAEPVGPVKPRSLAAAPHPDPRDAATLAEWIAAAERPLIVVSTLRPDAVAELSALAEQCAIPVVVQNPRTVCLPSSHPMHFGFEPGALLAEADLVVAIEIDVPWIPSLQQPPAECRIVHIGEDPIFARYPMRSFPSDLTIRSSALNALTALNAAVAPHLSPAKARIEARRARLGERMQQRRAQLAKASAPGETISPEYLSRAIGETIGEDAIIFNEYPLRAAHCLREKPGTLYALGPAGGLGWGLGAALGAKVAAPDKLIVATLGDGAYMFSNPTVGHWVSAAHGLPILTIVFNNSRYGAVRNSTMAMFKDGVAGENDCNTLADLSPSPAFDTMAAAQGAYAERVEKPADLPGALARARDAVVKDKRQALLNVICTY
ncbi:MAG: thiamine pyrophosphate-requiring protein [Xanthobacteraceae bacterium]|uniref:thiamine pyrophosphate-requiring protein n=1 Tax=Pseudolabrys sp. TaxID=1960880 RepID=UPI003D0CF878